MPIPPPPEVYDDSNRFARYAGLTVRAVLGLLLLTDHLRAEMIKGVIAGFKDGIESDIEGVQLIAQVFTRDPRETARAIWEFGQSVLAALTEADWRGIYTTVLQLDIDFEPPTLVDIIHLLEKGAYYTGYIVGFLAEQIVVAILLAKATALIGAAVQRRRFS